MERSGGSSSVPKRRLASQHESRGRGALRNDNKVIQSTAGTSSLPPHPLPRTPHPAARGGSTVHVSPEPWQNAGMQSYRHRRVGLSLLLGLAFAVSACGSTAHTAAPSSGASTAPSVSVASMAPASPLGSSAAPSAAGSPNQADQSVYAAIESQVEAIRQLSAKDTVKPVLLDSKGVSDWLTKANAEQTDHAAMANESRLLIHLGLLPAGSSLEQMELDLQAGQVIGFYDTVSKGLYVLSQSGGVGGLEKLTFSHEYTHALQDQNFGLDKLATNTPDQGDRDLARTALPEGDATLVMTLWSANNLSLGELLAIAGQSVSGPQADQLAKRRRSSARHSPTPTKTDSVSCKASTTRAAGPLSTSSTPTRPTRPRRSSTRSCTRPT